jgi:hypothetical protein
MAKPIRVECFKGCCVDTLYQHKNESEKKNKNVGDEEEVKEEENNDAGAQNIRTIMYIKA